MGERREGQEGPIANSTRNDWQLSVPQPAAAEGPPVHTRNWHPRLQKLCISSSFFLRKKTPFLVLIVCCSGLCNWYNRGQPRSCVCVCVCVCYVWILRKAAWYFIFKLWLLLHSPTYNGSNSWRLIVFCYQFSKKNKATQANATKRTGAKFLPEDFHSHKNIPRDHKKYIKPPVSSQLHATVLLQAVEYCASPSNCCGFRDFSRFLFLEICWSSASFPQLSTRPLCVDQYSVQPFIMKWRVETGISFSSPESRTCNRSPRSQKVKEAKPRHANHGLVLWFTFL